MPKIIKQTGSAVDIWGYFRRPVTREPVDPDTVEYRVISPDGTVVIREYGVGPEVVRDAAGAYYTNLQLPQEGTYHWKWIVAAAPDDALVIEGELDSVSYPDF